MRDATSSRSESRRWYDRDEWIVGLIVLVAPLGIALMWLRRGSWDPIFKLVVSGWAVIVVYAVLFASGLAGGAASQGVTSAGAGKATANGPLTPAAVDAYATPNTAATLPVAVLATAAPPTATLPRPTASPPAPSATALPPTDTPTAAPLAPTATPSPAAAPPPAATAPSGKVGTRLEQAGLALAVRSVDRTRTLGAYDTAGSGLTYLLVRVAIEDTSSYSTALTLRSFSVRDAYGNRYSPLPADQVDTSFTEFLRAQINGRRPTDDILPAWRLLRAGILSNWGFWDQGTYPAASRAFRHDLSLAPLLLNIAQRLLALASVPQSAIRIPQSEIAALVPH